VRVLFVAMAHSVHTARWISQVTSERGWDVHLFPVEDGVSDALRDVTLHEHLPGRPRHLDASVRVRRPGGRGHALREWLRARGGRAPLVRDRARELADLLRRLRPDVVHSLEMLKAGALVRRARAITGGPHAPWIASHWGSEMFLLGRQPHHRQELEAILAECDELVVDCTRDTRLAREMGLRGRLAPILPAPGGFDLAPTAGLRAPGPPSARRWVTLKGYHGWAGRALVALAAFERCASALAGYRVAVHSADPPVVDAAATTARRIGVPIEIVPPRPHAEILRLHGRSRVSIGLSISDGLSCSLLEAIAMGSFPVQSDTGGAGDWLRHEETALFVPPEDVDAVARALQRALTDDALVDRAAAANAELVRRSFERSVILPSVLALYERAVAGRRAAAS
jgi:hypothetical protein